ncbi:MAG: RNA polymerase sigma factor [bacterium]
MQASDRQLIEAAAEGRDGAFAEFCRRHTASVLRYCLGRLRDRHAAQDAAQEAALRMVEQVQAGKVPDEPFTWLLGIARNCCNEHRRQSMRHRAEPLDAATRPPATTGPRDTMAELLESLGDEERGLILMKHAEGLKCREIAQRTGKPIGTITRALSQTYTKLRQTLGRDAEEREP